MPSESARQRRPESSPAAFSSGEHSFRGLNHPSSTDPETRCIMPNISCLPKNSGGRIRSHSTAAAAIPATGAGRERGQHRRWRAQSRRPATGGCLPVGEVREWLQFAREDRERLLEGTRRRLGADGDLSLRPGFTAKSACAHPAQLGHAQFHCGNPPPAAEPRILTRMRECSSGGSGLKVAGCRSLLVWQPHFPYQLLEPRVGAQPVE